MPYSAGENEQDVLKFVRDNDIKKILDIGPGSGTYGKLLRDDAYRIDAVEIWEAYVYQFDLNSIYNTVVIDDIRRMPVPQMNYDLIIFGDVLEHMTEKESKAVWSNAAQFCKYGLISVPIVHYPQGAEFGNPYEEHVQEHMHPEDIRRDYGPFIFDKEYKVTGTFIKEFNGS